LKNIALKNRKEHGSTSHFPFLTHLWDKTSSLQVLVVEKTTKAYLPLPNLHCCSGLEIKRQNCPFILAIK